MSSCCFLFKVLRDMVQTPSKCILTVKEEGEKHGNIMKHIDSCEFGTHEKYENTKQLCHFVLWNFAHIWFFGEVVRSNVSVFKESNVNSPCPAI